MKRHFGESLFLASRLLDERGTLADLGSGAGFPGFPIAVANSLLNVTLIESVTKKATFLKEVSRGVPNVRVLRERFERVGDHFDWLVARAVALEPLQPYFSKRTHHLAVLTAFDRAEPLASALRLRKHEVEPIPWDASSVLLRGCFT